MKPGPSGPCIAEGTKDEGSKVGRRALTYRANDLLYIVRGNGGGEVLKEPAISPSMNKGVDGDGMDNIKEHLVGFFLGLVRVGFENFNKGLVSRVISRRRGMRGSGGAMRAQEVQIVKGSLDFAQDVRGDAAQIVIPEAMKSCEEPSHDWGRLPARGAEGVGNGSAYGLLGEGANQSFPTLHPSFDGNPRGPEEGGEVGAY